MFDDRVGCSSISFRHQDLATALQTIRDVGFREIDLGALPGVCDHVPYVLDAAAVAEVSETVKASGLTVRSVNGDIGDLNRELDHQQRADRDRHLEMLLSLTARVGAKALVLPCGAIDHDPIRDLDTDLDTVTAELARAADRAKEHGVELWTESLHFHRLCFNQERAAQLTARLEGTDVGIVMDFSHITASGGDLIAFVAAFHDRITHVHLRDAVPGNINLSIGNGQADFAGGLLALAEHGYSGHFSLELETRDLEHHERPAATSRAGAFISTLI